MITRFEVINHTKNGVQAMENGLLSSLITKWKSDGTYKYEFDVQDDGRTLKVFITDNEENT